MSELPNGWAWAAIQEITSPFSTVDPRRSPTETFRYVDIGSIDKSHQTITEPKTFLGRDAPSRARRVIQSKDVLFSTVRTYLKNIAQVPEELDGCLTSTGIAVLRAADEMDPRYLFHWVCSDAFVNAMSLEQDGSLYPAVTDDNVGAGRIPVPPAAEQRRIVSKLDALLAGVARARKELDRVPILIAHHKQALLAAAFSGELTREWRQERGLAEPTMETVEQLVSDMRYGTAQKCTPDPHGVAVLRIPNVASGRIDLTDLKYTDLSEKDLERLRLSKGDILVVRSNGSVELLGRPALVSESEVGLAFAGYLIRLRPNAQRVVPNFLSRMLQAPQTRAIIEGGARSTAGVNNINGTELSALPIPVPELSEQREIVERLDEAFGWLDVSATEHSRAANLLPKLEQAILAKAFRGELVPQDPTDEPASVLLERISAERAAAGANTPQRKPRGPRPPRAPEEKAAMTKSRFDPDVKDQPYLAGLIRKEGGEADAEALFRRADLPVADFYKQLAWEIAAGHVRDAGEMLEAA